MIATMTCFRLGGIRSYIAGSMLICELYGANGRSLVCDTWCDKVASHVSSGVKGVAQGRDGRVGVECMVDVELENVEELDDMGVDGASSFSSGGLVSGIVDRFDDMRLCERRIYVLKVDYGPQQRLKAAKVLLIWSWLRYKSFRSGS